MARRRKRRQTDWVVAHWTESQFSVGADQLFFVDLLSAADLEAHQDRMTVIRIVGSLHLFIGGVLSQTLAPAPTSRMAMYRIFKGDERDEPAGLVPVASIPRYDPFLTANADDEYMWQRELFAEGITHAPGEAVAGGANPHRIGEQAWYSQIDTRVMRKLSNEERIILAVRHRFNNTVGTAVEMTMMMFIRALVKLT